MFLLFLLQFWNRSCFNRISLEIQTQPINFSTIRSIMNSPRVRYSSFFLFFFFFLCFADLGFCSSSLPDHYVDARSHPVGQNSYTEYFELAPPLRTQHFVPTYTLLLLKYDFKNTTGFAINVPYWPPFECPSPWLSVVLQFRGACQGVQDDRIVGIWLEGVEILRTSTAQPTESGVFWKVEKDVTKYNSLLVRDNLTLSVMLENTVDDVFTGSYHVEISLLYYGLWLGGSSGTYTSTSSQPDQGGAVNRPKWNRRLLGWNEETGSTVNENQEAKLQLEKEDWGGKSDGGGNSWDNTIVEGQGEVKGDWGAKKEDWGAKSDGGGNTWDNTVHGGQEEVKLQPVKEDWGAKKEDWGAKNEDWGAKKEDWGAKNEDWEAKKEDWGAKSDSGGNSWDNTVNEGQEEKLLSIKDEWRAKKEDWRAKSDGGSKSWDNTVNEGQVEVKLQPVKEDWGAKKDDWGAKNEDWGAKKEEWGAKKEDWGAKKEDWSAKKEDWGAKNENWGAKKEDWGAKNEDWGAKKEDWAAKNGDWGAKNGDGGAKEENWGAKNEDWGAKKEDWGAKNEDWGAKNEDWGAKNEAWGAKNDGGGNSWDNTVVEGPEKVKLELNKEDWGTKNDGGGNSGENTVDGGQEVKLQLQKEDWGAKKDGGGNSWKNAEGQEKVKLQLQNEYWGAKSDGGGNSGDNTVFEGQDQVKFELKNEDWGAASGGDGNSIKTEDSDDERKSREFISNRPSNGRLQSGSKLDIFYEKPADLIIPISSSGSKGYWFKIKNETDVHSKEIWVPRNAYRAVLEIYVSAHANDEFWYSNLPTEYFIQNNLTSERINGAFRQVFVTIDDLFVGSAEPFPVIYSGGINPLLWDPIVGIGAFELPTYDLDLTPFLTFLIDGNSHFIRLGVADAISYWLVDANLHLWLDPFLPIVTAGTIRYKSPDLKIKRKTKIKHLDGKFEVEAERKSEFSGWVCYSAGNFTTQVSYEFKFKNEIELESDGTHKDIEQNVKSKTEVKSEDRKRDHSRTVARIKGKYPLRIRISTTPGLAFDTFLSITNVTNGLEIKSSVSLPHERKSSNLANSQESGGWIVARDHFVLSGTGNTRQKLRYKGENGCYSQTVKAETGVILENVVVTVCDNVYSSW